MSEMLSADQMAEMGVYHCAAQDGACDCLHYPCDWARITAQDGRWRAMVWALLAAVHQAAYMLPRANRYPPEARDELARCWEDVARKVAQAALDGAGDAPA
jgi:hypothetical protein